MTKIPFSQWVPLDRLGYLGDRRDEVAEDLNVKYGRNMWAWGWKYFGSYKSFGPAYRYIFERSYWEFFSKNPDLLEEIASYDECYCIGPADIDAGLDHRVQVQKTTHLADIAIRNCLLMFGMRFHNSGTNHILEIGGPNTNGHKFNPGVVPFFLPEQILGPKVSASWSMPGSIDDFWQNNKFVMVHPDAAPKTQLIIGANT